MARIEGQLGFPLKDLFKEIGKLVVHPAAAQERKVVSSPRATFSTERYQEIAEFFRLQAQKRHAQLVFVHLPDIAASKDDPTAREYNATYSKMVRQYTPGDILLVDFVGELIDSPIQYERLTDGMHYNEALAEHIGKVVADRVCEMKTQTAAERK